jgi:hypothetical protein
MRCPASQQENGRAGAENDGESAQSQEQKVPRPRSPQQAAEIVVFRVYQSHDSISSTNHFRDFYPLCQQRFGN